MAEITKQDVISFIEKMTVLDLAELVKELEEKFGVSAAAATVARPSARSGASPPASPSCCSASARACFSCSSNGSGG